MTKWVYDFAEGSKDMRDLLGGKGANVAEMTRVLGPDRVPAGFTITTEACVEYMRADRSEPEGMAEEVAEALGRLEEQAGKTLGDRDDPLLVSVRSGARESMPGMLDTVLNLGLNDESVEGLARDDEQRALRVGLLPPLRADVRQRLARDPRREVRGRDQGGQGRARGSPRTPSSTSTRSPSSPTRSSRSTPSTPAMTSPRIPRSSCGWPSGRCSTPGWASVRSPTGA